MVVSSLRGRPRLGDDLVGDAAVDADGREAAALRAVHDHQAHEQRIDAVLGGEAEAIGAMIATAAGLTAPTAVSSAAMKNMIHGMAAMRPRTARTPSWTSQSIVPLFCASANR